MGSTELKNVFCKMSVVCIGRAREKITQKNLHPLHIKHKRSQYLYALERFFKHFENQSSFWQKLPKNTFLILYRTT